MSKRYVGPRSAAGIVRTVLAMEEDPQTADVQKVLVAARAYRARAFGDDAAPLKGALVVHQTRSCLAKRLGQPLTKAKLAHYLPGANGQAGPGLLPPPRPASPKAGQRAEWPHRLAAAEALANLCGGADQAHDALDEYEEFLKARRDYE